jgi:hypothetical protein
MAALNRIATSAKNTVAAPTIYWTNYSERRLRWKPIGVGYAPLPPMFEQGCARLATA